LAKLKLRKEHLILAELQRLLPELDPYFVDWDCPIKGSCTLVRPDMIWEFSDFFLTVECDEFGHNQPDSKNAALREAMHMRRHLLVRVNPDHPDRIMLRKRQLPNEEIVYQATKHFEPVMLEVRNAVRAALAPLELPRDSDVSVSDYSNGFDYATDGLPEILRGGMVRTEDIKINFVDESDNGEQFMPDFKILAKNKRRNGESSLEINDVIPPPPGGNVKPRQNREIEH